MDDLIVENGHVVGVNVSDSSGNSQFNSEKLGFDSVVLGVGHSARDVYQTLLSHNVELVPKDFAVSFSYILSHFLVIHLFFFLTVSLFGYL